jgi:hypothetical protein
MEVEYNNYHPGTGMPGYDSRTNQQPQSQNLAKLVPVIRDYGSPNVKKLKNTSSTTQFINPPQQLSQPFNPPKRLIHHAHK